MQTVLGSDLETLLPPFSEVRRVAATVSLARAGNYGATKDDLLRLYEEDDAKLVQRSTKRRRSTAACLLRPIRNETKPGGGQINRGARSID